MKSDLLVIGGGAAGLFAAWTASQQGKTVSVLERNKRFGLKILISGGGRCNFTNLKVKKSNFHSQHPNFPRFALENFSSAQFVELIQGTHIPFHEKKLGQLFCDRSSKDILNMLLDGCRRTGVYLVSDVDVQKIQKDDSQNFTVQTSRGSFGASKVLIATGGLSFPKLGVSDFGYKVARQFGHKVTSREPALVPLVLDSNIMSDLKQLAGVSCPVIVKIKKQVFEDDLLFTHWGLSGPAILKASLYWQAGEPLRINLLPNVSLQEAFQNPGLRSLKISKYLDQFLPHRLVQVWLDFEKIDSQLKIQEIPKKSLNKLANQINQWTPTPIETEGFKKAEVTRGGVSLDEISPRTLESKLVPGLYFAGEVLDVTGWLGGYNFQWAWSSGYTVGSSC